MAWWIYKCNNRREWHGKNYIGDWATFFKACGKRTGTWGRVSKIPQLADLQSGDSVFAYQTERNELVGLLTMVTLAGDKVRLRPTEVLGVKVRPLKHSDPKIAAIRALQQGPKETLQPMSASEAKLLLKTARAAASVKNDMLAENR